METWSDFWIWLAAYITCLSNEPSDHIIRSTAKWGELQGLCDMLWLWCIEADKYQKMLKLRDMDEAESYGWSWDTNIYLHLEMTVKLVLVDKTAETQTEGKERSQSQSSMQSSMKVEGH